MNKHYKVVIVGGGAGGISTASRLLNKTMNLKGKIAIIEPKDYHAYQPAWPLVGSGAEKKEKTIRKMKRVLPEGAEWIQQKVIRIQPVEKLIRLDNDKNIKYDYLVLAPGIQLNFNKIKGAKEALGKNNVCTNYIYELADYTYQSLKVVKSGNIIVTKPNTPIKGGVAPENTLFTFDEYAADHHYDVKLIFKSGKTKLFPVKKYEQKLHELFKKKDIPFELQTELIEVDGEKKIATFRHNVTQKIEKLPFSMLVITPPMSAPDFIQTSTLSDDEGWLDLDPYTLQHVRHQNVFGIGDCTNLPTVKMGAAVRQQVPVLVDNLISQMNNDPLTKHYDGKTACPVATEYGKAILAEFGYDLKPKESFLINQANSNAFFYFLKKKMIPFMYWNAMLKGKG